MNSPKKTEIQLLFSIIVVLLFWLTKTFLNRLHDDDFIMVNSVKEFGVWGSMNHFYNGWNTRWAAYLLQCSFYQFWTIGSKPFCYNFTTIGFMIFSSFMLIKSSFKKVLEIKIQPLQILKYGILFFGGLIIATYHVDDTWFWVSGSTMYGWNLGCGMLIISFLINDFRWYQILVLILLGLFIGGAAEPFAVCSILAALIIIVNQFKVKRIISSRLIITCLSIIISFGIAFSGNGHAVRSSLLPSLNSFEILLRAGYFSLKLILWHSPIRLFGVILMFIPFYNLGTQHLLKTKLDWKLFRKEKIIPCLLIWIIWLCVHCLLITKLMGNYGPPRAWSSISLLSALLIAYLMLEAGKNNLFLDFKLRRDK